MLIMKPIQRYFSILGFYSAFDYHWDSNFSFSGESHNYWELVYVASGSTQVTEDANIYHLTEGNFVVHAPLEFHKIQSASNTSPHVMVLSFSCDGALPDALCQGVYSLTKEMRQEYETFFMRFCQDFHANTPSGTLSQEWADALSTFLIRLSRTSPADSKVSLGYDAQAYRKLVQVMESNLDTPLTLEEIAGRLPVSVSYMKLLFRRYAGISPKLYYNKLRATAAIRLLEQGSSASQVATTMGFSSPNYFSTFFKRMTGQTPAVYMNLNSRK